MKKGAIQNKEKSSRLKARRLELLRVTQMGKLSEIVSFLAHEISQPLTSILAYAQAASRRVAGKDPQLQEILQYIIQDDHRASAVIRRLRSLLKKSAPEFVRIDMNEIVNDTVALLAADAGARHPAWQTVLDPRLPMIRGDRR
ncbi:MAG: hypothetical protein HQL23_08905 [Candidatus Omnitrophica bacterium]|nr:hypothetical protein [Candidatus Omnitrophota bacterium]